MANITVKDSENCTIFGSSVIGEKAEILIDGSKNGKIFNAKIIDKDNVENTKFAQLAIGVIAGVIVLLISWGLKIFGFDT